LRSAPSAEDLEMIDTSSKKVSKKEVAKNKGKRGKKAKAEEESEKSEEEGEWDDDQVLTAS
jgi:hypothetical protein